MKQNINLILKIFGLSFVVSIAMFNGSMDVILISSTFSGALMIKLIRSWISNDNTPKGYPIADHDLDPGYSLLGSAKKWMLRKVSLSSLIAWTDESGNGIDIPLKKQAILMLYRGKHWFYRRVCKRIKIIIQVAEDLTEAQIYQLIYRLVEISQWVEVILFFTGKGFESADWDLEDPLGVEPRWVSFAKTIGVGISVFSESQLRIQVVPDPKRKIWINSSRFEELMKLTKVYFNKSNLSVRMI